VKVIIEAQRKGLHRDVMVSPSMTSRHQNLTS
jgi:hypothetical protein